MAVQGPPRRDDDDVFGNVVNRAMSQQPADRPLEIGESVTIALYRNGSTVNDGPLRDPSLPENRQFIASIEKGEVPAGLNRYV